jgi:hypothetical protein
VEVLVASKGKRDVHKADGERNDQLSTRFEGQVELVEVVCWPDVDNDIETAIQCQDGEVLIAWAVAHIAFDCLIPVAVDGPGYIVSICGFAILD